MSAKQRVRLELPCETFYLATIRHLVQSVARRAGFAAAVVAQIQMAVDEVCAAAAFERRGQAAPSLLTLVLTYDDTKLVASVIDAASQGPLALHDLPEGLGGGDEQQTATALGSVIVTSFMDEVEFCELDGGCEVRLTRYLRHPSARLRRVVE